MSINVPDGVLEAILARLDALEQQQPGAQEALVPNTYSVDESGSIAQPLGRPARAYCGGALNLPPGFTAIPMDAIVFDPDGAFSIEGGYNVPYAGVYLVMGSVQVIVQNNPQNYVLSIFTNPGAVERSRGSGAIIRGGTGGDNWNFTVADMIAVDQGDEIYTAVFNNGANNGVLQTLSVPAGATNNLTVQQLA